MNNLIKKQILMHTFKYPEIPSIFIDTKTVIENYENILKNAPKNFHLTFPVKSCPHHDFLEKISPHLHGFEISNQSELSLIENILAQNQLLLISNSFKRIDEKYDHKNILFDLGYLEQLDLAMKYPKLSLRVQPSIHLEQSKNSRFGLSTEEVNHISRRKEITAKVEQLHFHIGFEKTTISDLTESIRACVKLAQSHFPSVKMINIGGGVNLFTPDDFSKLFDLIKSYDYKFILEAGRFFFKNSSYALGKVLSIRQRSNSTHILTNLSYESHLKWSWPKKFYIFPHSSSAKSKVIGKIKFYSLTAFEDDCLLISDLSTDLTLSIGDHIIFDNISGYSVAWNHDFNGVGLANIVLL